MNSSSPVCYTPQCVNSDGTTVGNRIVKVVQEPLALSAAIVPLCCCTICRAIARLRPCE